jgi:hypothetical protein
MFCLYFFKCAQEPKKNVLSKNNQRTKSKSEMSHTPVGTSVGPDDDDDDDETTAPNKKRRMTVTMSRNHVKGAFLFASAHGIDADTVFDFFKNRKEAKCRLQEGNDLAEAFCQRIDDAHNENKKLVLIKDRRMDDCDIPSCYKRLEGGGFQHKEGGVVFSSLWKGAIMVDGHVQKVIKVKCGDKFVGYKSIIDQVLIEVCE